MVSVAAIHDVHDGTGTGSDLLLSGGDSVGLIVAGDAVAHVADEPAIGQAILQHHSVAKVNCLVLTEGVGHLLQAFMSETKLLASDLPVGET